MPSKANQPKTSLAQRNFHIAKATRLFSRKYRAIDEENFNFNFEPLKVELKIILADVEESTLFLLDNLPEITTADQLIADFTKIQDEYDDLTEKFSSIVQHASANRPEETCNNRSEVHLQTPTDATIADTSGQTLAVDNHTGPSIQNAPTNHPRLTSADVQLQADTQQPTPSTTLDPPHNTLTHLARPKLKIEPYDGDPMKWNLWYGLFKTLIHDQPISLAEKMTHLQTLTIGVANQAISGFSCNSQMYDAAIAELQRRFGRPEIIVNKFLHLLQNFRQPSIHQRKHLQSFLLLLTTSWKRSNH